jgi:hypothetical protein
MRTNLPPKPPFDNLKPVRCPLSFGFCRNSARRSHRQTDTISSTRKGELLRFEISQKIERREALMRSIEEIQLKKERKNHRTKR